VAVEQLDVLTGSEVPRRHVDAQVAEATDLHALQGKELIVTRVASVSRQTRT
jgi:hypothetical protein